MLDEVSRSLPPAALHPATAILFLLLLRAIPKTPHASGRLLLVVVWLRYVMQAYHDVTYVNVAGVSINALASLVVCLAGALVLRNQLFDVRRQPLILGLIAVIVASGILNAVFEPTVETLLKWGYFLVVLLAVQDCMRRDGDARILGLLLWSFAPPLVYQALSIVLGVTKATESDGSVSYIGGYNHEAAFSIVLVTCFAVASLAPRLNIVLRLSLLAACLAGILAANYRTSFIAVAPMALGYFGFGAARNLPPGRRALASIVGLVAIIAAMTAANIALSDRMSDISAMAVSPAEAIRPPEEFTVAEQKLLSGRLYIWSRYVDDYRTAADPQLLVGFGPDAWTSTLGIYAHNTLVSYLYEFGAAGVALLILIWLAMIGRALAVADWALRGQLVCMHIGFILLNLATMPFWLIEGLILYGLLCGYTLWASPVRAKGRPALHPVSQRTLMGAAAREK